MAHKATQPHTTLHLKKARFLAAYTDVHTIKSAAAAAGIHRSSVYRWRHDPAFVDAMTAAEQASYQKWRAEVLAPLEAAAKKGKAAMRAYLRQRQNATQPNRSDT